MGSMRALIYSGVLSGVMTMGGAALAQTNVPPPDVPPTGTTMPSPNEGGIARGVVSPPRQIDPEMVTPPPEMVKPTMPVIKPPVNAR